MLWRCEAKRNTVREIGAGGLRPPSGDNLKRKILIEHFVIEGIFPINQCFLISLSVMD
jgi:hypothetical protein